MINFFVNCERFIKNDNYPVCKNCIYFQPNIYNNDFDTSKCLKFGSKDIITSKIKYDYVSICRQYDDKCGQEGKYFQEEKNISIKLFKNNIISNLPIKIISLIIFIICIKA
jgi:hypothetical protein